MARLENKKDIFKELNEQIKELEKSMTKDNENKEEEESATEKVLNSILEKGLSIIDKVLSKIDEKLDDEEFMSNLEKYVVNVTVSTEETVEETPIDPEILTDKQKAELNLDPTKNWRWIKKDKP